MNFNEIIKANKENVKKIIRLVSGEENEDLEQEVYLKVWKNADKYEERGSLKGWINTVAKNTSKDFLKSSVFKHERTSTSDELVLNCIKDTKQSPEEKAANLERRQRIITAIDGLKPKLKEVVMLCEIYGCTYEEAAKKLNCPVGTIKSRIFTAKRELAEILNDLL